MHVKSIFPPFLSSRCMALRNRFFHCCLLTKPNKTDNIRSVSSVLNNHLYRNDTPISFNLSKKHLSRYSASTIMRPHTKTFNFKDYDVIGFDLDGTLLRYNLSEMVPLEYELITRYLVQKKGYSKKMLENMNSSRDKDFWQKGLFIDTDRGNILKLRSDGYILRANHGTKSLSSEDINEIYGNKRQWSVTMEFIKDPLCAWNGPLSEKMRSLLDYFDTSASLVFANAVDDIDSRRTGNGDSKQTYQVWPDVLEALIHIYTRENFSNGKSEYFQKLKAEPSRYIMRTSPAIIAWLKELKASNKMLFLLTGSNIDFANFTASYAMGENWRDLFDVVVCFARKPGFFHAKRPFYRIEGFQETDPINIDEQIKINSVYSMGNWQQLQNLFASEIGKDGCELKSLYVGDNLVQDVYAPSALSGIDSIAVSEEILSEYSTSNDNNPDEFCFRDIVASNYWGSYFFEDDNPTVWTDMILKYSKMCIPTLDEIATQPIDHQYLMCNEYGFFPSAPRVE